MPDRIEAFIEAVAAEIRWKKARPVLTEEIRTHLLDQRDAYAAQGMAEDAAQAEAVRQMGDPVALGTDLDRIHRPRPQWGLLALALVLWKQRGKRWRGAAVCLGRAALAAAACCLCPSVYALVLVTMAGLVLGLFFALRDWLGLGLGVLAGGFPLVVSNTNTVLDLFLIALALSALRNGSLPERAPAPCRKGSVFLRRIRWEKGELILSLRPKQG